MSTEGIRLALGSVLFWLARLLPSRLRAPAEDACLVLLSAENFIVTYFPSGFALQFAGGIGWSHLCLCLAVCSLYKSPICQLTKVRSKSHQEAVEKLQLADALPYVRAHCTCQEVDETADPT